MKCYYCGDKAIFFTVSLEESEWIRFFCTVHAAVEKLHNESVVLHSIMGSKRKIQRLKENNKRLGRKYKL